MRNSLTFVLLVGAFACTNSPDRATTAAPAVQWTYEGSTGPQHWAELSPAFALARDGKQQSPIDIAKSAAKAADQPALVADYKDAALDVLNNGHTIEDDYHGGGTLTVGGKVYKLAQFHFHSPSEHTIDGKHAPMEMHLVHKDAEGKLAVVGVLIQEGAANPELEVLWKHLPKTVGRAKPVEGVMVNAKKLLPPTLASYRYSGSLTTPPCSEQVAWFVLQQPITASAEQIATFQKIIRGNNRPVQPLHGRTVTAAK
jgi:carbonic anhydrase